MSAPDQHMKKWRDPSRKGNLRPHQEVNGPRVDPGRRSVVRVNVCHAAEPACKLVLPGEFPPVQVPSRRAVIVLVRVSAEQLHLVLRPRGERCKKECRQPEYESSSHGKLLQEMSMYIGNCGLERPSRGT